VKVQQLKDSVGIEHIDDIIADFEQALAGADTKGSTGSSQPKVSDKAPATLDL
jgi:hypothetical protein